ncbi:MAG: shikimate kinase [Candidatus Methylacidiphilales bacterium]
MKVILLGNAGSGKSTLAKRLVSEQNGAVVRLSLDEIAWDCGTVRKPLAESRELLKSFMDDHEHWIIEGCYGELIELALPFCEELRFLNPGVATCIRHCRSRPWEPEKFSSPDQQSEMLDSLIEWVSQYETRTDEFGLLRHRAIFDGFAGRKIEYNNVESSGSV